MFSAISFIIVKIGSNQDILQSGGYYGWVFGAVFKFLLGTPAFLIRVSGFWSRSTSNSAS